MAKRVSTEGLKTFCGTPFYFAPEVLRRQNTVLGMGRYGTAADIWSLGVILYILLSGSFPFDEAKLYDQIQYAQYSLSGPEWHKISDSAKHLIRSLMTLRPEQRINVDQALSHPWITEQPFSMNMTNQMPKNQQLIQNYLQPRSARQNLTAIPKASAATGTDFAPSSKDISVNESKQETNPVRVPIGNVFWSIRASKEVGKVKIDDGEVGRSVLSESVLQISTPSVSLFEQVMNKAQSKESSIANVTSAQVNPSTAVLDINTRSVSCICDRNSTDKSQKALRQIDIDRKASRNHSSAYKRKVQKIQKEPGVIVLRYCSGNSSEDEYRELPNDQIESYSSDGDSKRDVPVGAIQSIPKKSRRSSHTAMQKINRNTSTNEGKAVYSLEKAWKLDQPNKVDHTTLPQESQTNVETESKDFNEVTPSGSSIKASIVSVHSCTVSDYKSGHGNDSKSLRKQPSKRKLRQPVKSMADIFKRKIKHLESN